MRTIECDQGTPEWWDARKGVPTASCFARILTPKTGKLAAAADSYICELIADTFALSPKEDGPKSRQMQNGIITEPEARRYYELVREVSVARVGFCLTDDGRFGCSPDSLVGDEGGLELKCPEGKTHVQYILDGTLPDEYKAQVHGSLIVTGRKWWDFMSYCPGLPPLLLRVEPDTYTATLRSALEQFWTKYQATLAIFQTEKEAA